MPKDRPVHEVRLGAIKASVWRNDSPAGVRYNATFSRLYKEGEEWKSSDSFGRDDLLVLAKVADRAHSCGVKEPGEYCDGRRCGQEDKPLGLCFKDPFFIADMRRLDSEPRLNRSAPIACTRLAMADS